LDDSAQSEARTGGGGGGFPDEPDDDGGGEGSDPVRWVTVASFPNVVAADIAQLKLESEQIPCVVLNRNLVSLNWLWTNAFGGLMIQVPEHEVARATAILAEKAAASPDMDEDEEYRPAVCGHCGSRRLISATWSRRWAMLGILFLGWPIPFLSRQRRCADCGQPVSESQTETPLPPPPPAAGR
jgi:DNA-directed RNA polymerase subunit RPC12/RpoP